MVSYDYRKHNASGLGSREPNWVREPGISEGTETQLSRSRISSLSRKRLKVSRSEANSSRWT